MKSKLLCAATLPLFLAACGGGDSGSSTPTPTVTPAPTPTPTAPVEPAPAMFHTKVWDFGTVSWLRFSPGVEMNTFMRYEPSGVPNYHLFDHHESELHIAGGTAEFSYAAEREELNIKYRGYLATFPKESRGQTGDWFRHYVRSTPCDPVSMPNQTCGYESLDLVNSMLYEYVAVGRYGRDTQRTGDASAQTMRYFLFGSESVSSEMPVASTYIYEAGIVTSHPDFDKLGTSTGYQGTGTLTVNFAAGTLDATIAAKTAISTDDVPFRDDTFKLAGTIASNKLNVNGGIVNADGKYAGRFTGAFYGPGGSQIGLLVRMVDASAPSRPHLIGYLVAKRK